MSALNRVRKRRTQSWAAQAAAMIAWQIEEDEEAPITETELTEAGSLHAALLARHYRNTITGSSAETLSDEPGKGDE